MFEWIVGLGAVAGVIFVLGIVKGVVSAFRGRADDADSDAPAAEEPRYAWTAALAVVASAVVIALAGVAPVFIYLGPLLAIGTAAGVGAAFLIGERA